VARAAADPPPPPGREQPAGGPARVGPGAAGRCPGLGGRRAARRARRPHLQARAGAVGYANVFEAVDRSRPWRPVLADDTGARLNPRPTAPGYQTALVVGADGQASPSGPQELHSDALGRIKVK